MNYFEQPSENPSQPRNLVVLLHGLGSNGEDMFSLVPFFAKALPNCHFFSPNGIEKCDSIPFGYQWFNLDNRAPEVLEEELFKSAPIIIKMIEDKLSELNLGWEDLILVGFSQGSMVSLYLALSHSSRLCAVVSFSGALILPRNIVNRGIPVCLIHGEEDDVLDFTNFILAQSKLYKIRSTNIETLAIRHLKHTIDLSGIKFASDFLKKYAK
ncbi:MAG: alpha/beta fold hydrolase [Rickettsiaceae bacterium]|nr:alpha/beta fold hydrolase [Rickettsiaceae bacterium]